MNVLHHYLPGQPTRLTETAAGTFSGVRQRGCYVYRGIHYGRADRFQAPLPLSGRQTPDLVAACPQDGLAARQQSEACLSLNVYAADTAAVKPVLVYVHGGSFARGSNMDAQTQGHRLAAALDLVVVTVNYRLGVFGFFDFSRLDAAFSRNPAILDLLLALQFVKANIAAFGGDPANITVMGESAGGSLAALLATLNHDDTFAKVILSSPVPTAFIPAAKSRRRSEALLARLGIETAEQLLALPAAELAAAALAFAASDGGGVSAFAPAVDGTVVGQTPLQAQLTGRVRPRPTWIGVTADEMSILTLPVFAERWQIDKFLPQEMRMEKTGFEAAMLACYRAAYPEPDRMTQLYSDLMIRIPTAWYAQAAALNQPTWLYRFDYAGPLVTRTGLKAFHTIDLYYLFDTLPAPLRIPSNLTMVKRIQDDLKQFLYHACLPWPTADGNHLPAKYYADSPSLGPLVPPEILAFWQQSQHYARRANPGFEPDREAGAAGEGGESTFKP